jgi:hypothetical protein
MRLTMTIWKSLSMVLGLPLSAEVSYNVRSLRSLEYLAHKQNMVEIATVEIFLD